MATLRGTANNDTLNGTASADTLSGYAGDDTLRGGAGNDTLDGGLGNDQMYGGLGNDTFLVDDEDDDVFENANEGIDLVKSTISYVLGDYLENLTLAGSAAINGTGNDLDNILIGNTAANTLTGGAGNDTLDGGIGIDTLIGGTGNDIYTLDVVGDTVVELEDEGIDTVQAAFTYILTADLENLTLTGSGAFNGTGNDGNNILVGNAGANILTGGLGHDTLNGGRGADRLIGGLGDDTYVVDMTTDVVVEVVGEGTDTVQSTITYSIAALAGIENLTLIGTTSVNGTGNALDNVITGNNGANVLNGGAGTDTLAGGLGNDTYVVDELDIVIESANAGTDTVQSALSYTIGANIENLTLLGTTAINATGNELVNTLLGNAGNNILDGGLGADKMTGGLGADTYIIDNAGDMVTESANAGIDTVRAGISYTLGVNVENLTLTGTANINASGNTLANILTGNAGNNVLDGKTGADTMIGGAGNDTYIFDVLTDTAVELADEGIDTIQIALAYTLGANIENLILTGTAALNGTGNALDNALTGNSAANRLIGGAGNDTLDGGAGADTLDGGIGNDIYVLDNVGDVIVELAGEGSDTVKASFSYVLADTLENLTLIATANINATGNAGDNVLTGNAGHNVLDGKAGADTMAGGIGNDTYLVDDVGDTATENSNEGMDLVQSSISYVLGANIENLTLTGTANLDGTGNAANNTITGNAGNNILDGGAGADTLAGGVGDDTYFVDHVGDLVNEVNNGGDDKVNASVSFTLGMNVEDLTLTGTANINATGNASANTLIGNAGNNVLDGKAGADTLAGGLGDDTYVVDHIDDIVTENAAEGTDTVQAGVSFALDANIENLTLTGTGAINATGNALDNRLTGNTGNNILDGGAGNDTMAGGLGNDTYVIDSVDDEATEAAAAGTDTVQASITINLADYANIENATLTGTADLNATGTAVNNALTGNDGNNLLDGGLGLDTMAGGLGNDIYVVDNIGDIVTEAIDAGTDTVRTSLTYTLGNNIENLTLTGVAAINGFGNAAANIITGNAAANVLDGKAGADTLIGGAGNDTYVVDNSDDVVVELLNEGTDLVNAAASYVLSANVENLTLTGTAAINGTGNALNNVITGNSGNNILDGGAGADTLSGGTGNDAYVVDNLGDILIEAANGGTDTVQSYLTYVLALNFENLTLLGTANINATGNALNNVMIGNAGNNIIDGGAGKDNMAGGLGSDTYMVDNIDDDVTENASEGTDTVQSSVTYTLGDHIENLILTGTAALSGTGNALNNTLTGNAGNNTIDGGVGADTMAGGAGDDIYVVDNIADVITENLLAGTDTVQAAVSFTLGANIEKLVLTGTANIDGTGNTLDNFLTGNAGNNILDGGLGLDTMAGGLGDDTYVVDNGADILIEGANAGIDTVRSAINYTLAANFENLTLTGTVAVTATGNAANNVLVGNAASNILDGAAGADTMSGGLGNDTYVVDNADDVVIELAGEGTDTIFAQFSYTLAANVENLMLGGTTALSGTGNAANNVITGNSANNIIDGGLGADTMIGGSGNDTYFIDNAADIITENAGDGIDTAKAISSYTLGTNVENLILLGNAAINATGNTLANVITGNTAANIINGGGGGDTLLGGLGDDTYVVDSAGDTIIELADEGNDTVQASITYILLDANVENLTLTGTGVIDGTGNALANTITGNSAGNIIDGGLGADTMNGAAGNDTYLVDNSGDTIIELNNGGTDTVLSTITYSIAAFGFVERLTLIGIENIDATGNALGNTLVGNSANNVLDGGVGSDSMSGGDGDDTYIIDSSGDAVIENAAAGNDTVRSSVSYTLAANVENLVLTGAAAINGSGNALNNILTGNGANNVLNGGTGDDIMIGGGGNDTYYADDMGDEIIEIANAGTDTVVATMSYTLSEYLENLTLSGSANLNATGNAQNNVLAGNTGNNILDGGEGADNMSGGSGNDLYVVDNTGDVVSEATNAGTDTVESFLTYTLGANVENLTLVGALHINGIGNSLNNVIVGNAGNNILDGGTGIDNLSGGAGDDFYYIDNTGDIISEFIDQGTDTVQSSITHILSANVENLILSGSSNLNGTGNALDNVITGNAGNNTLDGGAGADTLNGGLGNDIYLVDNIGDVVNENAAAGTDLVQASVSHTLSANVENLTLTGTANTDATGNDLNNILIGNSANNILYGGGGTDTLTGGAGADTFLFDTTAYQASDTITDFNQSAGDKLDLSALFDGFDPLENAITDFLRISTVGSNSIVEIDRDGAGTEFSFAQIATLNGATGLTDEDALVQSGSVII